ncbi:hypothetical protein LUZ60_014888 [Juncus effusus]|nr:hypothetical protein LUZ60_014888 [Juncus effusus]
MASYRMVSAFLFCFLLLAATEMGPVKMVLARHCYSQSHRFKGTCFSSSNCGNVCRNEGFPDGSCHTEHMQRKCILHCLGLVMFRLGLGLVGVVWLWG